MEEKGSSPSPYLVFIHGEDNEKLISVCPIAGEGGVVVKEVPRTFQERYHFKATCSGEWLIVCSYDNTKYSLWNPLTADTLDLPDHDHDHDHPNNLGGPQSVICGLILTSPPSNPNCMVILYEKESSYLKYWRIGDQCWSQQRIEYEDEHDSLYNFVVCNGKIYCLTFWKPKLVIIDTIKPDGGDDQVLAFRFINTRVPNRIHMFSMHYLNSYMVESCGELFMICLIFLNGKLPAIKIFRFDFEELKEEWTEVESFYDRAFFWSHSSQFSCPAAPQPGGIIQANHVYFLLSDCDHDFILYSFNMKDKTILFTSPYPDLSDSWLKSFWITSNSSRLISDVVNKENKVDAGGEELTESDNGDLSALIIKGKQLTKHSTNEGDFDILNSDIQFAIARRLNLQDYLRFRAVNSCFFRLLAPPNRWTKSALLEGSEVYDSLAAPWLMFWEFGDTICNFIDPISKEKYFISIPNNNVYMMYSKGGWCVVIQGEHSAFLWNPFSKTMIPLPYVADTRFVVHCGFSSSPEDDSLKSDCTVVLLLYAELVFGIYCTNLGDKEWRLYSFKCNWFKILKATHPVVLNEAFYVLDENGKLGVFREDQVMPSDDEDGFTLLNQVVSCPCEESFHQQFLLECDGKLLSVFVGFVGRFVQIFKLDELNMVWHQVESLENHTLYLSHFSAFSTKAAHRGMHNRIYFPKYHGNGNSVVYYFLDSKQLHSHDSGQELDDFYDTREQLLCGWLSPKF